MYSLLKVVHIGSFMLWLGPALGSWLVLRYIQQQQGETSHATSLVYRVFFLTLTLEHIAFFALLITGTFMAYQVGWFYTPWLQQKLWLVMLLILPLEMVDIWLGNWQAKRIVELRSRGNPLTTRQEQFLHFYHHSFTKLALLIMPPTILLIMWLAVSKQPIW